jgi:Tol biopolymer transport system component
MAVRWALALAAATAIMVASSGGEAPPSVCVPAGLPVTLDGILGDKEWGDALATPISDAVTLYLKYVDGTLCLGVRAPEMGVGNLLIAGGDSVRILHSSAALGTAVYEPAGDAWRLKTNFVWRCRSLGASEVANAERKQFLETDGWLASTAYMGNRGDLEYQIAVDVEPVQIAFLWLPVSDPRSVLSWPANIRQDATPGPVPTVAHFDVSEWATVTMQAPAQAPALPCSEPRAGTIAFSSSRNGNTDIYTIHADGSGLERVTAVSSQELEPCWKPNGLRLAYQARRPAWQIYTALVDGSDEQPVTDYLSWSPAWSPDGLAITYSTGSSIQRIPALGGKPEALVARCGDCGRPAWSPDGLSLAFHSNQAGNQDVYVMDLGSGDLRQLTHEPSRDFLASWSPDGTRLVFTSDRNGNLEIYTMRTDGSEVTRLTDNSGEDLLPAWSPSGEWIAFVSSRDGNREIYLMRPDGSCVVRLTNNPGDDMYPAWKPE